MKRLLQNFSIKQKLTAITVGASSVVLILAGIAITAHHHFSSKTAMTRDITALSQVIGANSSAALVFSDPDSASKTLDALRAKRGVIAAVIYTKEGDVFATYLRDPSDARQAPYHLPEGLPRFGNNGFELSESIWLDGDRIGTVYILSDLAEISESLRYYILIVLSGLAVSIFLIFVFSSFLQKTVSHPIDSLANTARHVTIEKDYSVRAEKYGEDELGLFVDVFNEMLTQIQFRDRSLQEAHDKLEGRVKDRTVELQRSNQDLEAFSYSVSHDLRAPLRAIAGFTKILQEDYDDKLDEEGRRVIDVILKNTVKMEKLIDNLLEFSRLGQQAMKKRTVDMTELAGAVIEDLKALSPNRTAEVTIRPLATAEGDPDLLRQVFVNLVSNAFKYSRHATAPKIEIASETREGETVYSVKDNGAGFDMAYRDKLFGVFQRLHTESEFEGTGVGLAMVQRVIQRHNGRVWAEGKPNEGATFYFTLPIRRETRQDNPTGRTATNAA